MFNQKYPNIQNYASPAPTSLGAIIVNILSVMRPPLGVALSRSNLVKRTTPPFLLTVMPQALRVKASTN
jgi:hypothetical protein